MCGRYTLRSPWLRPAEQFGPRVADLPDLFAARFNVAPTQAVLAIGPNREGQPAPAFFRWGLVPAWKSMCTVPPRPMQQEQSNVYSHCFGRALPRTFISAPLCRDC
jgi:putative SOS response-associated peptidase YedK